MPKTSFAGIWPAMLTPLNTDGNIDHVLFVQHAQQLLSSGCGGVTPFGTTGEGASFSVAERVAAVDALVAGGIPASRIIVSVSAAALTDALELTRHAQRIGAHGCLMLPPFYFKGVSDEGVIDCYSYVLDRVQDQPLRMYLYHLPQVSAVGLSHEVIAALMVQYPHNIAGIKDSQCVTAHSAGLHDRFGSTLPIYVGNELDLMTMGRLGSKGAISGLANFWPERVAQLVEQPDGTGTSAIHDQVQQLLKAVSTLSLIPALKVIMAWYSGNDSWLRVRAPLRSIDDAAAAGLRELLQGAGLGPKTCATAHGAKT